MRTCEQCGLSISDAATFCAVCGARVDPFATPATAPSAGPASPAEQSSPSVREQTAGEDDRVSSGPDDAVSRRLREAALPMQLAGDCEQSDPVRSAALYRETILRFLDAAADPLDRADVRHDLLFIFDRLSLVLKREGLPEEALEEIDSAASLGLLACQDRGIKTHREALKKRRESLRRSLADETSQL
jgi:uncharacterized Zn finger protein (UPF0148 family)